MREMADLNEARAALIVLLKHENLPEIIGMEKLTYGERLGLTVSCCAVVIEHTLIQITGGDRAEALKGWHALASGVEAHLK